MGRAGPIPVGNGRWPVPDRKKQATPQGGREHLEEETKDSAEHHS